MDEAEEFIEKLKIEFLDEAMFLLAQCEESYLKLEQVGNRKEELARIFRAAHTIKGGGATVGFTDLVEFAHVVEECLSALRVRPDLVTTEVVSMLLRCGDALKERIVELRGGEARAWDIAALTAEVNATAAGLKSSEADGGKKSAQPAVPQQGFGFFDAPASSTPSAPSEGFALFDDPATDSAPKPEPVEAGLSAESQRVKNKLASQSVKVDADRIDQVLNAVGELVVIKSQLVDKTQRHQNDIDLHAVVAHLETMLRELQTRALGFRMTPLKPLFVKTQRLVRDLSLKLGKPVEFTMEGEDTEIDRQVVEQLSDPLLHIVRNALDHGIETPERRELAGKPAKATLSLSGQQIGSRILIRVREDGAGIDCSSIIRKAVERGLLPNLEAGAQMRPEEVYNLLFLPGFSTASKVTDISGRGVGLDVVKTCVEGLKGSVSIESSLGHGTCFTLSIPLTSSITDGIHVKAGHKSCIIPMEDIRELCRITRDHVTKLDDRHATANIGDRIMPLMRLEAIFGLNRDKDVFSGKDSVLVVVIECNDRYLALIVDHIVGQVQVVLKPLSESFSHIEFVAGAAILGDGSVSLILTPQVLIECFSKGLQPTWSLGKAA